MLTHDWPRPTENKMTRDEKADASWRAIRAVTSPRQFQVIIMRVMCGMTNHEIAADLGVGTSCIKSHLADGVNRVRAELETEQMAYG